MLNLNKKFLVSAIVPVFNEEKTIKKVVKVLLKSKLIDEVICVNDGSTDKTLTILKSFQNKIKLINLKKNHGKGFALVKGIKKAKGEIVTFVDGDLVNLSEKHLKTLLTPILEGKTKVILGYRINKSGFPPNIYSDLAGERAYFKKDLLPHLKEMAKTRFGVEVFLNNLFKGKIKKVPLKGLKSLYKYQKYPLKQAIKEYLKEVKEIAKQIEKNEKILPSDSKILKQIYRTTSTKI